MTEANMKKLHDHFKATKQFDRAKEITDIPRYAKFAEEDKGKEDNSKPKKEK